jgi:hypothetical protein
MHQVSAQRGLNFFSSRIRLLAELQSGVQRLTVDPHRKRAGDTEDHRQHQHYRNEMAAPVDVRDL